MSDRLKGRNRRRADTLVVVGAEGKEVWEVGVWVGLAGETHRKQTTSGKKAYEIKKKIVILMVNR